MVTLKIGSSPKSNQISSRSHLYTMFEANPFHWFRRNSADKLIFNSLSPVVTLKIGSSPKSNQISSRSHLYTMFEANPFHWFRRNSADKLIFNSLSPMVTLIIRSRSSKSKSILETIPLVLCTKFEPNSSTGSGDTVHTSLFLTVLRPVVSLKIESRSPKSN